jgi:FdrA protein
VISRAIVRKNQYQDSVRLMTVSRAVTGLAGVAKALVLLGTDSNKKILADLGLLGDEARAATPNDLLICIEAESEAAALAALAETDAQLLKSGGGQAVQEKPTSVEAAAARLPGANFALFSIPGAFAKLDVVAALESGLNVMLFSDNISVADEVFLKKLAVEKGLLMMGPDCGTAIIGGVPLAFANVVRKGSVGIVGASGTGIQEVTCLIDRFGGGVSHAIGVGGRDLKKDVGGLMSKLAIEKLLADPDTASLLLVSKPGDPAVMAEVLKLARSAGKPVVACLLGDTAGAGAEPGLIRTATLEAAALAAVPGADPGDGPVNELALRIKALAPWRTYLRGLYSGGTLCYEALLLFEGSLDVHSNIARRQDLRLPYPGKGAAHCCVDFGEDEFTVGRAHPMIDSSLRCERLAEDLADKDVAAVLLDVVLGYGAASDPAGDLAAVIARAAYPKGDQGPVIVAHVCGTPGDPQGLSDQEAKLAAQGVLCFPTGARAALAALAAVLRKPDAAISRSAP